MSAERRKIHLEVAQGVFDKANLIRWGVVCDIHGAVISRYKISYVFVMQFEYGYCSNYNYTNTLKDQFIDVLICSRTLRAWIIHPRCNVSSRLLSHVISVVGVVHRICEHYDLL